jgi:hypothetical protein
MCRRRPTDPTRCGCDVCVATFLGVDADAWGVVVASVALAVAIYGASIAKASANAAKRSAGASERSADATVASAEASARAAGAAEASAQHSKRSASAAERSATADERAVAIDEERVRHEARERADRDAPRWAPISEHEEAWWISDDNNLSGTLVNVGSVEATVTGVDLDLPAGGGLPGRFRAHPAGPADSGFVSELDLRSGGALAIHFQTTDGSLGPGLHGDVRPRVRITARGDDLDWEGTRTIELLRKFGGVSAALRWQPRAVD